MIRWASCALLALMASSAWAEPPKDAADVFPAGTLAYAELNSPGEVGPQVAALFKGTPLEDSIPFVHAKKDAAKTFGEMHAKEQLAELALLVSPEVLAECRKMNGIAVGLTGFSERGEPEAAVAVLTGDSTAAGFAARAFITTSSHLREVAKVSKVPVFQYRPPGVRYDPQTGQQVLDNDKKPTEGPHEPTFAYTPGLFVIGTSRKAIEPVIKRFLGEEKDSLRGTDGFKAAAATYRKPGVFFYANAPELTAKLDAAGRVRGEPYASDLFAWMRITANPKALKWVAGRVQFRDGGVALTVSGKIDPAEKSPLLDFFSGPAVKVDALHHARRPALFAATVNLPEKDRGAVLVGFLDSLAKAQGVLGKLPSDHVKEVEEKHKLKIRNEILAKVRSVTVVMPAKQDLPKGAKAMPMIVLHMDDADAAATWEGFLPKLVGDIAADQPAQPATETVDGVKVFSLAGTSLPWKSAVHYARKGEVLVIGQDRKLVAAATTADAANSVTGGDSGLSLPKGDLALAGTVSLGELISVIDLPTSRLPGGGPGGFGGGPFPAGGIPGVNPEEAKKELEKARAEFVSAFNKLPPAAVAVRRSGDEVTFELFQPKVEGGGLTPVINAGTTWLDRSMSLRSPSGTDPNGRPIYRRW